MIAGIDYGSKVAGTTVICYDKNGSLHFQQSKKKQDADQMITQWVKENSPELIMLDAPLSLPIVYTDASLKSSYHYRQCDQELKAMSPMFLGGLTARAMQLCGNLSDFTILETYPKQVLNHRFLKLKDIYKNDIDAFGNQLQNLLPKPFTNLPQNWHQVDGSLAWYAGYLYTQGKCDTVGDKAEGLIHF